MTLVLFEKVTGVKIEKKMIKILDDLGFEIKEVKKILNLKIPSWRPDISQEVDVIEELIRIKGYNQYQYD